MINYKGGSICNILPSISDYYSITPKDGIKRFGLKHKINKPFLDEIKGSKRIVIFQIDALGFDLLTKIRKNISFFKNIFEIDSTFPTYTLPAFASFLTGTPPSIHGLVSGTFKIGNKVKWIGDLSCTEEEFKKIILSNSLLWDFERKNKKVVSILYDVNNEVYSRSLYPNPEYISTKFSGNDSVKEAITVEKRVFNKIIGHAKANFFILAAYFAYLDGVSGKYGKFSKEAKNHCIFLFAEIVKIFKTFPPDTLFIFMGDHGHMSLKKSILLEEKYIKEITKLSLSEIALDGRVMMVYSKKPLIARKLFKKFYGKYIQEISRNKFKSLLGGNCSPIVADRVGNIIFLAKPGYTLRVKPKEKKATHGGMLKEETETVFGFYKN
ncbi:hypothetical protein A2Z67_02105 [Candidatus Woesebacteria bacterium RBG_13_36_22]|uniref:Phosphodiesterase n=1 Tax=Candidatus Woesebacteria bacterium RBG_13_36_22 TaxID=1802478 RepID=A0A1F7X0K8_9BACT|nr:MAG: hypothetical protein A2Z67_02105 [Candidatus Woesebacteria bacterium RBG_13_36_22]